MQLPLSSQVHVWQVSLASSWNYKYLTTLLNPPELARSQRLRLLRQQQRWIVARGVLRLILSLYLQQHPARISLLYNTAGKPYLAATDLTFNLSHSGDMMLLVLASKQNLGVDIEQHRHNYNQKLAKRLCSVVEYRQLQCLSAAAQLSYFYKIWTAKEALIKAQGGVFSFALATITVPISNFLAGAANLRAINWHLQFLSLLPQYHTAVVSDQKFSAYVFWQYTPHGIRQWRHSTNAVLMPFYE